jgi:hypothetical protein
MLAKLYKREDRYDLYSEDDHKIASSASNTFGKLSKQNCDEIFGVVDVEKLAEEYDTNYAITDISNGFHFIEGFNKAMELNKDKLFGVKEVVELCKILLSNPIEKCGKTYQELTDKYIQSLQQPTEIEVEIEMEDVIQLKKRVGGITNMGKPKLDSEGCLILKRIV